MEISPVGSKFGARVSGIDLRTLTATQSSELHRAFGEYSVLIFPQQHLSDDEQIRFSRRFGRLERGITPRAKRIDVTVLTNASARSGQLHAAGSASKLFLDGNNYWHTDSSFKPVGAKASLLSARVVPTEGGNTEFADMRAAYDALTPSMQRLLADKVAMHSYRFSQSLIGGLDALTDDEWAAMPPVQHAVIKIHPESGRRSLYLGRHAECIVGMGYDESRALIDRLNADACAAPRVIAHRWSVGDLVMWDNRAVQHRGRPWPADQKREMHRTTIAGDGENAWAIED